MAFYKHLKMILTVFIVDLMAFLHRLRLVFPFALTFTKPKDFE